MTLPNEAVEAAARAMAQADGLDWDEPCGVDGEEGFCDSGTCISAHYEDHDAEQARRWYLHVTTAALTAALPIIRAQVLEEAAKALEDDAKLCDCFARSEGECGCGAWNDYKTVPMERAVALVRALKENHP
ncbi:MAG: hypothetical protein IPG83_02140 [Novosphingobium sp.]|nr:hypothetical protein [Novosphingobium sp.]